MRYWRSICTLRALAGRGYELAVLSNGTSAMIGNCLNHSGLGEYFGLRISVDEVRVFKPSPAAHGHAAGMRTAWVNRSAVPFDTIGQPPDLTVPALDQLPAALAA